MYQKLKISSIKIRNLYITKTTLANFIFLSIQPVFNFIGQLLLIPYYTKYLGLNKIGELFAIMVVSNVFVALIDFNLLSPTIRRYENAIVKKKVIHSFLILKIFLSLIILFLGFFWLKYFTNYSNEIKLTLALFIIGGVVNPYIFDWYFISEDKIKKNGYVKGLHSMAYILLIIIAIPIYPYTYTLPILSNVLSIIVIVYFSVSEKIKNIFPIIFDLKMSIKIIIEASPIALMQFIAPFGIPFGLVALQQFSYKQNIMASFGIGQKISLSFITLAHPIVLALIKKMSSDLDVTALIPYVRKNTIFSLGGYVFTTLGLNIFVMYFFPYFVELKTDSILVILFVMNIYMIAVLFIYLRVPLVSYFLGTGKTKMFFLFHTLPILCLVGFTILFANQNSYKFVAVTCASTEVLTTLIFFSFFFKKLKF